MYLMSHGDAVRTAPSEPLHLRKDATTPHSGPIFSEISPNVEFVRNEHVNYTGKNNVTAFHMGEMVEASCIVLISFQVLCNLSCFPNFLFWLQKKTASPAESSETSFHK